MKAIMYHYVRPVPEDMKFFRFLRLEEFGSQLEWLAENFGFVSQEDFFTCLLTGRTCPGVVLTFDDGFVDHYDYVLPTLKERGLWGIFYIPTAMYSTNKLLDVHRIHLILGKLGGTLAMDLLRDCIKEDMLSHQHVREFHEQTYLRQNNDAATNLFKRTLNYFISYDWRENLLDDLIMKIFDDGGPDVEEFYLSPSQIRSLVNEGMIVGSHGSRHLVFSKLDVAQQRQEIQESFRFLEQTIGKKVISFCFPYGGLHTFTKETEQILSNEGTLFSFAVDPRDITSHDLLNRPQALPRYDCIMFPHGNVVS